MTFTDMNTQALNRYLDEQDKIDQAYERATEELLENGCCDYCKFVDDCIEEGQTEYGNIPKEECFEPTDQAIEDTIERLNQPPEYY